mgnify:CR=1 FL=1
MRGEHRPAWAVVRVDDPSCSHVPKDATPETLSEFWGNVITVKTVMPTFERATREAQRLNAVNKDKDVFYFVAYTRVLPDAVE